MNALIRLGILSLVVDASPRVREETVRPLRALSMLVARIAGVLVRFWFYLLSFMGAYFPLLVTSCVGGYEVSQDGESCELL
jgi:hypothetical protein